MDDSPDFYLSFGDRFPYDAGEDFWRGSSSSDGSSPPPIDWAHRAARGIMADLDDRKGISESFQEVDHETRADLVRSLAEIIRTAARAAAGDVK